MKLAALDLVTPLRIRLQPTTTASALPPLGKGDEVKLRDDDDTIVLVSANGACDVQACDRPSQQELSGLMRRRQPTLAWVAKTGAAEIQVDLVETTHTLDLGDAGGWVLGYDAKIRDDLKKRMRLQSVQIGEPEYAGWLRDQLVIAGTSLHPKSRLLVSASPTAGHDPRAAPFRIWGSSLAVDVRWTEREGSGAYLITRVIHASRLPPTERRPIWVVVGDLAIRDEAAALSQRLATLDAVSDAGGGYVKLWEHYHVIEEGLARARAEQIGALRYTSCSRRSSRWHFVVHDEDVVERLGGQRDLELEARGPEAGQARIFCGKADLQASSPGGSGQPTTLVLRSDEGDSEPPPAGVLRVSLRGQEANWKRRQDALRRIEANGESSLPLTAILEGRQIPSMHGRHIKPLSPAVRALFEPHGPTSTQIEALEVALNTPDLAIIQGPPGTGKTQVIRALALRLSELGEGEDARGGLLLSSFQHEAVQHVAGAIRIFGLPAVKLGGRRDRKTSNSHLDEWRIAQLKLLAERPVSEPRPVHKVLDEARALLAGSLSGMTPAVAAKCIVQVNDAAGAWLPAALTEQGQSLRYRLEQIAKEEARSASERARLRGIVFGVRTSALGYADDGPQRLSAVFELARSQQIVLDAADSEMLDDARLDDVLSDATLAAILAMRDRLLDGLAERVAALPRQESRDEVSAWLRAAIRCLHDAASALPDDAQTITADFRDALEQDRDGVEAAIAHYTAVLAATCVQSVAPVVVEKMGLSNQSLSFYNVVVDEAARANPLDLLIPMSIGKRRIILVGDHRQLPHSLEPDVERAIDQDPTIQAKEALKSSLFERLKVQLAGGNLPRVVTLDRQFRMHPVLARFVSDTFYQPHGEAFESGVTAIDREHGLSELGTAVAAWIDVPLGAGKEKRQNASFIRSSEARVIAKRLRVWLAEDPSRSFAVVTFYAAQVDELWSALAGEGLAEGGSDGEQFVVHRAWRSLENGGERLRIGTVDAFQGKEFDVVILSQVRSNDRAVDGTPSSWRQKWGFLLLANRMCVALSRQKRALIVVGDPAMVEGETAATQVAGLSRFRALCGGEHGLILDR